MLPDHIYPPNEWSIVEEEFAPRWMGNAETIFALSNGFLGVRGTFEEGRPSVQPGAFCNGFHETWPIVHAEEAYGFAQTGQTIVNVPDPLLLKLYVDDEPLYLPTARLTEYRRELDFRRGTLQREMNWSSPAGKQVHIASRRVISFDQRHIGAISYEITLDTDAPVVISSQLLNRQDGRPIDEPKTNGGMEDPRRGKGFGFRVLNAQLHQVDGHRIITGYRTTNSKMTLGVGMDHIVETENHWESSHAWTEDLSKVVFTFSARAGVPIRLVKFFTYHISRSVAPAELVDRSARALKRVREQGFDAIEESQAEFLESFWSRADVRVDADPRIQQAIRWNIFQLCQASARAETAGIPAKGLTGQAYEGHYFWDAEIYVAPFLSYTDSRIARNLLRFRHTKLDFARRRASELSEKGALFPWRTINGEEASSYYAAGTAQYHINADIAYAIRRYVDVRGDPQFLAEYGAEILIETARMWVGLGFFSPDDGVFHIHGVTGPDEYTTVVNDNTFTNLMARVNLRYAADIVDWIREINPEAFTRILHETELDPDAEPALWRRAAEAMALPFDSEKGMHLQDENFLERERWDFEGTPTEKYPLLLHFHPLVIYRHQVIKQADIVLAMVLLGNEFTRDEKRRNFDYYDPLTTGDSSLSACVQSILAAEIGYEEKALEYFRYALFMDLADIAANTVDGSHIASCGGVWMALTYGFAGMTDFDGKLGFDPRLPAEWKRLSFPLRFQDRAIRVDISPGRIRLEMAAGEKLSVTIRGTECVLGPEQPVEMSL
jgi:alpha,alpha-trehalose phosphorylase